ncbi:hypothetical protein IPG36_04470 [bacterium]|nr:MAG: hypothetical protein IPG36_04470 [bacterium]
MSHPESVIVTTDAHAPLTPNMEAVFVEYFSAFDQAARDWEERVRAEHVVSSWRHDYTMYTTGSGAHAYDQRFSMLLGMKEQGAPVVLCDHNSEDQPGSNNYVWPLFDPQIGRLLFDWHGDAEGIGAQFDGQPDPIPSLAHAIWLGHLHLPNDHFTMTSTSARQPTQAARAWVKEQGYLGDAIITSMLANNRQHCGITHHRPTARDKIMFYHLVTQAGPRGRIAQPFTPQMYHELATHRLRVALFGAYRPFALPENLQNELSSAPLRAIPAS